LEHLPELKSVGDPERPHEIRQQLLKRCERNATDLERDLIQQLLPLLHEFVESLGFKPKSLSQEQIHFFDTTSLTVSEKTEVTEPGVVGAYRPLSQVILVFSARESTSPLEVADTLVHEMLHSQTYSNIDVGPTEHTSPSRQQRIGIRIIRPDRGTTYFRNLDEAVTTTLTGRFFKQYGGQIPTLEAELHSKANFIDMLPKKHREQAFRDIARLVRTRDASGNWKTEVIRYPYAREREQLQRLVTDLYEQNAGRFASPDELFKIIVRATFTGRLLPFGRIVERTYGQGSFRRLGEEREG
jgi:hypothetical protein